MLPAEFIDFHHCLPASQTDKAAGAIRLLFPSVHTRSWSVVNVHVFVDTSEFNWKGRKTSASPKPHPSKPYSCNMAQAKTEVALQISESCTAETALQHSHFCSAEVVFTKSWAAASEKLQCKIEKAALQELALSCRFPADFRPPRLPLLYFFEIIFASASVM